MTKHLLIESEALVKKTILMYFNSNEADKWLTTALLEQLFCNFSVSDPDFDMVKFFDCYEAALNTFVMNSEKNSKKDAALMRLTALAKIKIARPIKVLFQEQYLMDIKESQLTQYLVDRTNCTENTSASIEERDPLKKMANDKERVLYLIDKFGENGVLDLSKVRLPKRFQPYIASINKTFHIDLDIIVTKEERRVLVEFAKCRTEEDIELLLSGIFNGNQVSSGIRYLRMAISGLNDLWEAGDLDQAEGWMRENLYTLLFDRLFLLNKHFKTKRGECYSAVIEELHDMDPKVARQRVDFILRSVNDKSDYTSTEEKASNKSTANDIQKGRVLQRGMLDTWQKRLLHSSTLVSELEAITCQWRGREMFVLGTKLIDDGKFLAYKKASLLIPSDIHHCATASRALMVLLSIMHNTTLNFMRMSNMLDAISELSVKKLEIDDSDNYLFRDDSLEGEDLLDCALSRMPTLTDNEIEKIRMDITNIRNKYNQELVSVLDWETLILDDHSGSNYPKKRHRQQ